MSAASWNAVWQCAGNPDIIPVRIAASRWRIWTQCNTWFLGPTSLHADGSIRFSPGYRQVKKCGVDMHGEREERKPITGSEGGAPALPSRVQGQSPGQGVRGKVPRS